MPMIFFPATIILALYLTWGFKYLPAENRQVFAVLPGKKDESGVWTGINLTWYGLLTANAYAVAVTVLFILLGTVRAPLAGTGTVAIALLACCVPASRIVARIVEKKAHTFTVGGAVFVGTIISPWLIVLINKTAGPVLSLRIPVMETLAAISIAYAFGEGLGRLACISFGCCYGKPLESSPPWQRRLFEHCCFIFHGKTKKISYASGLDGARVIPVQAVTAILYSLCGLVSTWLFLASHHTASFLLAITVTQLWRTFSENLRADFRGEAKTSAYQIMGIFAVPYSYCIAFLFLVDTTSEVDIYAGIASLWRPEILLFIQVLWLGIFLYTGRSTVTGAHLTLHVHRDRI